MLSADCPCVPLPATVVMTPAGGAALTITLALPVMLLETVSVAVTV